MPISTTNGPVEVSPAGHRINTSRLLEDMVYEDEGPEILAVLPGTGWQAMVGGEGVPLVAFVAMDDGKLYGVAVGEDGRVDLRNSVEDLEGFQGYEQANNNDSKE